MTNSNKSTEIHHKASSQTYKINTWKVDYLPDSSDYYLTIRHLPNPVWLDSGRPHATFGRYDILTAAPSATYTTTKQKTVIHELGAHVLDRSQSSPTSGSKTTRYSDPFKLVESALEQLGTCEDTSFPFTGGALGYFGYNLRAITEPRLLPIKRDIDIPDMLIGIYKWAIIQDHHTKESYLIAHQDLDENTQDRPLNRVLQYQKPQKNKIKKQLKIKEIKSKVKVKKYRHSIEKIQDYISAGDCYQVNFAQRFEAKYTGDSFLAYQHLRQQLPAPFGCYMEFDGGTILSHSPERFLKADGKAIETKPIKGTIERGNTPQEDDSKADWLLNSQKDRAENLMIVDLLRNDLSKTCKLGSVKTPDLFQLESYANVHHLVSKVIGTLDTKSNLIDLFKGCFPGGSITGAPKIRAMEIIDEIESLERSVYCGSIGYISSNGKMDTNIAIRTIACDEEKMYCWGGGGIVADSEADDEYQESLQKVNVLLEGLKLFQKPQSSS